MSAEHLATQPHEFRSRRRRLMDSLTDGAIVIAAGHDSTRNNDVDHQYRQESSFWYLTGFDEPDGVAVLRPGSHTPYTLFVRPYDPTFEIWVGRRAGVRGAVGPLAANAAYPLEQLDAQLPKLLAQCETIYYALGSDDRVDGIISGLVKQRRRMAQRGAKGVRRIEDPTAQIDAMRQVKTDEEIALLQRAIDITAVGFQACYADRRPRALQSTKYRPPWNAPSGTLVRRATATHPSWPAGPTPAYCTTSATTKRWGPTTCC